MEVGGHVEGWRARRRLEGTSKVGGHVEGWRARRRLEGTSKVGGHVEGWRAHRRLEGTSKEDRKLQTRECGPFRVVTSGTIEGNSSTVRST
jgi:hypothetical protein